MHVFGSPNSKCIDAQRYLAISINLAGERPSLSCQWLDKNQTIRELKR